MRALETPAASPAGAIGGSRVRDGRPPTRTPRSRLPSHAGPPGRDRALSCCLRRIG